jgi:hypothetical protein
MYSFADSINFSELSWQYPPRQCSEAVANAEIPEVKSAYYEACKANGEKLQRAWSHSIVYHAGKQIGWYLLKNYVKQQSFPIFEYNYGVLLVRLRRGEELTLPIIKIYCQ